MFLRSFSKESKARTEHVFTDAILISKFQQTDDGLFDDIIYGDMKEVDEAIKSYIHGHNNFWSSIGHSLLANAASNGLVELVQLILKNADTNNIAALPQFHNLLLIACIDEYVEIVQLLLVYGFDPNKIGKDRRGDDETCLYYACREGNMPIVELLIKYGADPNMYCPDAGPPLLGASMNGHYGAVKLLLEHGAKVDLTPPDNYTALDYACSNGFSEVVEILLEYGADINYINSDGDTPLISLVECLSHEEAVPLIRLMLANGADSSIVNNKGKTAIDYVAEGSEIARLITDAQLEHILK